MKLYLRALGYFRDQTGKITLSLVMIGLTTLLGILAPVPLAMFVSVFTTEDRSKDNWLYDLLDRKSTRLNSSH